MGAHTGILLAELQLAADRLQSRDVDAQFALLSDVFKALPVSYVT